MSEDTLVHTIMNCETGEVTIVPLTADELAAREQAAIDIAEQRKNREAEAQRIADLKESAKAKLIAGEPLTEEEAATIVL